MNSRLARALRTTMLVSVSLFLMLVGVGKLLIRTPDETLVWPLIYIAVAARILSLWWREAFGSSTADENRYDKL